MHVVCVWQMLDAVEYCRYRNPYCLDMWLTAPLASFLSAVTYCSLDLLFL